MALACPAALHQPRGRALLICATPLASCVEAAAVVCSAPVAVLAHPRRRAVWCVGSCGTAPVYVLFFFLGVSTLQKLQCGLATVELRCGSARVEVQLIHGDLVFFSCQKNYA